MTSSTPQLGTRGCIGAAEPQQLSSALSLSIHTALRGRAGSGPQEASVVVNGDGARKQHRLLLGMSLLGTKGHRPVPSYV